MAILISKSVLKRQLGVEGPNARNEELQLRLSRCVGAFMFDYVLSALVSSQTMTLMPKQVKHHTVLLYEFLDVPHNFPVALMSIYCHTENTPAVFLIVNRGMRMQHKRNGQEAFDPFNLKPSAVQSSSPKSSFCQGHQYQLVPAVGLQSISIVVSDMNPGQTITNSRYLKSI